MKTRIFYFAEIIRSKFWLVPSIVTLSLIALLFVTHDITISVPRNSFVSILIHDSSSEGSRLILSSIATALMTVVGVLFSITIVILQQVSAQYSPRVIENFIRSLATQVVLGFYIGTFAYALLLLRSVHGADWSTVQGGVRIGVTVAIVLAVICLALLIYYVHHIAKSIKSIHILAGISNEAIQSLNVMETELSQIGTLDLSQMSAELPNCSIVRTERTGYLQEIKLKDLSKCLKIGPWRAEVLVMPGDYLHQGLPLLKVFSSTSSPKLNLNDLASCFQVKLTRTYGQDPRFGIRQMVDIALRALSPGINDPSTAIEAVNEIGTVLTYFTQHCTVYRRMSLPDGGTLELKRPSYEEFLAICFNQIIISAKNHYVVLLRIINVIEHCTTVSCDNEQIECLRVKEAEVRHFLSNTTLLSPHNSRELRDWAA